jgi:hypothetical protein
LASRLPEHEAFSTVNANSIWQAGHCYSGSFQHSGANRNKNPSELQCDSGHFSITARMIAGIAVPDRPMPVSMVGPLVNSDGSGVR